MLRSNTKVVATIGPASEGLLGELIDAGLSVARLNFSHGTHDDHLRRLRAIRQAADERGVAIGVLADIQGPKLRLGTMEGGLRRLRRGDELDLRESAGEAREGELTFDVAGFQDALDLGHRIFLADGVVELIVESRAPGAGAWRARVRKGGKIGDRKGVNLPDTKLEIDLPTAKDREDLAFAREHEVDMIGVSFVADADDIRQVRELAPDCQIVAKIERSAALENIVPILDATDGIMVARGDLGVEVELERLPMIQKTLLQQALERGRFTITATEMLESMVDAPRPTRAEAADVANAVLDGTDAVMLSAETAVGSYPVEAVQTMVRIAREVESSPRFRQRPRIDFMRAGVDFSHATAHAAVEAAEALRLRHIVCFTESGYTARLLSRYRPLAKIVALSPHARTLRRMAVLANVQPLPCDRELSLEGMLGVATRLLVERGLAKHGESLAFVAGVPPGRSRTTNVMKLHRIGESMELR